MESDRIRETAKWDVDEIILRANLSMEEELPGPQEPKPSLEERFDDWMNIIDQ